MAKEIDIDADSLPATEFKLQPVRLSVDIEQSEPAEIGVDDDDPEGLLDPELEEVEDDTLEELDKAGS